MSNAVDYYDVERMIRDARHEIRAEINSAITEHRRVMYAELAEVRSLLGDERVERQAAVERLEALNDSLERVLHSRTDHLA